MAVSDKDRKDYEEGKHDSKAPYQGIRDFFGMHPGTEAYYKGRRGEQLDGDKKDDKKK